MKTAEIILQQLGGSRFITFTGSHDFIDLGNTLRMTLARNKSKANRLEISLRGDDTYTVRFYRYTPMRWNPKRFSFSDPKTTEVKTLEGIYCDQLREIFTRTTGLYTSFSDSTPLF